ncbi:hypothetical protein GDO81_024427, partial [Engystomops pustulosus]
SLKPAHASRAAAVWCASADGRSSSSRNRVCRYSVGARDMADGERSPLLSDLGDGGGLGASVGPGAPSPVTALPSAPPYGGPGPAPSNKPQGFQVFPAGGSVLPGEDPPPYSPLTSPESGSAPMITCRVCQSLINVEGKMHQHVVKCGVCNEATVRNRHN